MLKAGVRLYGVEATDKVWLTCCALHNWLLDIDGLDEVWENGILVKVTSEWLGDLGDHDFEGVSPEVPNAIVRLSTNLDPRKYDSSAMGPGEDVAGEDSFGVAIQNDLYSNDKNDAAENEKGISRLTKGKGARRYGL